MLVLVLLSLLATVGGASWFASAAENEATARVRALEGRLIEAQGRQELEDALQAARQGMLERGLDEALTLAGRSPEELPRLLSERRDVLRGSLPATSATLAQSLADAQADRRREILELHEAALVADESDGVQRVAWLVGGCGLGLLLAACWLAHRAQLEQVGHLAAARASVAAGEAVAEQTRRDLERAVDEKTAALGVALEESRGLNARLQDAQEQLIRQEKMAALGTLAGGIAHEFNNLLGGIRGCAEDLRAEGGGAETLETLDVIVRAARRGRTIVQGLQTFSQAGGSEPSPVDLGPVAAEVTRLLAHDAEARRISFDLATEADRCVVVADPVELHQVVQNVVQNAVQASPDGGRVELRLDRVDDRVSLHVSDRGAGVPEPLRSRIFEPFFTTRELEGGTGLGLAITHGIIQALGGSLEFADRDGGGTTFTVELPYAGEDHGD